ncbi:hypothetical protein [Janthinobacterium lividum]|jgi:hypothetical protein|uniref:hypothetical protein n=1 Tax=Janthinobacterium sp. LB2P10 TaxID=3424194 RepID=UPI000FE13BDF
MKKYSCAAPLAAIAITIYFLQAIPKAISALAAARWDKHTSCSMPIPSLSFSGAFPRAHPAPAMPAIVQYVFPLFSNYR